MTPSRAPYHICVIDVGSPKLGNLGWYFISDDGAEVFNGRQLDDLVPIISNYARSSGILLGLEAPLFVPLRDDLMRATTARKGEGRRPWSAGAGAQVLSINLPVMTYLFQRLKEHLPNADMLVTEDKFQGDYGQILVFEALVSGSDKGESHIDDARIMAEYCAHFSGQGILPPNILEYEENTQYLNLTAASLLRAGFISDCKAMHSASPIYKPS